MGVGGEKVTDQAGNELSLSSGINYTTSSTTMRATESSKTQPPDSSSSSLVLLRKCGSSATYRADKETFPLRPQGHYRKSSW